MMLVPRSYMFTAKVRSNSTELRQVEGMGGESRTRQSISASAPPAARTTKIEKSSATVARTTEPVSIPSQPMYRPVRHTAATTIPRPGHHRARRTRRLDASHDPNALPPAVAALLAVTSIPPPKRKPSRQPPAVPSRQMTIDELIQEWRSESEPSSLGNRSPLDLLLEPCEDTDTVEESEDLLILEQDCEKESSSMTSRSVSSASLTSIPSLEAVASTPSSYGDPSTPTQTRRSPMDRKEKIVSSPPTEAISHDEDPLRPQSPVEPEAWDAKRATFPKPTRQPPKSTLKSNLTASLQALKSAAKSFSNFTAPTLPPDDLLTRSLLSPSTLHRYPSEMRPKAIAGVPDPALRRYMNPLAYGTTTTPSSAAAAAWSLSSSDLHASMRAALAAPEPESDPFALLDPPMIQMQTYAKRRRSTRLSAGAAAMQRTTTSSPPAGSAPGTAFVGPDRGEAAPLTDGCPRGVRQREHRENSDFLRVVVLEMNMRRTGKLDAKAGGRARVWLPPRKQAQECVREEGKVPVRWVGVSVED